MFFSEINQNRVRDRFLLVLWIIPALFLLNLFLISKGIHYTGYRDMLFFFGFGDFSLGIPFIIFVLCYIIIIFAIWNDILNQIDFVNNQGLYLFFLTILALLPQVFFIGTPETNPDFVRYIGYAQVFEYQGFFYYFTEWGSGFATHVDLPAGSLPFGILFSLFGENRMVIQIFLILILIVTVYFIFLIGEKVLSKKCGIIASCLFLTFPFLLTQIPLMLVDVISTFYLTLFVYYAYSYLAGQSTGDLLCAAVFFFLTTFSKILSPLFLGGVLAGLLLLTLIRENRPEPYQRLARLFTVSGIPAVLYFMVLSEQFSGPILALSRQHYPVPGDWPVICGGIIIGFLVFALLPLIAWHVKNKYLISRFGNQALPVGEILIIVFYAGFFVLAIVDLGKSFFYIRSLPLATGIIPAILALASGAFIIHKKHAAAIPLVLWILIPLLFIPNTMYKYFLPAYPALALVSALTICWIEDVKMQKCITLSAMVAGIVVALFVFYPMCVTDSQINIQRSAGFFDNDESTGQRVQVIYLPTTERFQDSERMRMATIQLPIWFNYYGVKKHEYSVIPILTNDEYQDTINNTNEKNTGFVVVITDADSIDNTIVPASLLENYSTRKVFNQGYHDGYWFDTRQVVILEREKLN